MLLEASIVSSSEGREEGFGEQGAFSGARDIDESECDQQLKALATRDELSLLGALAFAFI